MVANKREKFPCEYGSFQLLSQLGRGGMATVYLARHPSFPSPIALKIPHESIDEDSLLAQRFWNECRIGERLVHPNLIRVLGSGVAMSRPYLVLEHAAKGSLDQRIKESGCPSIDEAITIFSQLAEVLAFIHKQGLIHRDIKPANVLFDATGTVKLTDLGLLKDEDAEVALTRSRTPLGTPDFAAPEQFEDAKRVDHRCDLYSLAGTMYVAMSGVYPFGRGSQFQVLVRKTQFQIAPASRYVADLSPVIDQLLLSALQPNPEHRPASAKEFLAGLRGELLPVRPGLAPTEPKHSQPAHFERRRHPRVAVELTGQIHSPEGHGAHREVMIEDISLTGVRLRLAQAIQRDDLFNLEMMGQVASDEIDRSVQCAWSKELANGQWLIGGIFAQPLTEAELDLLTECLSKTKDLPPEAAPQVET